MKLSLTVRTVLAFLSILFVCQELHEVAHTALGRWLCGCWGSRDFSVWSLCTDCPAGVNPLWPSLAGPTFSYLLMWAGYGLMSTRNRATLQSAGWALLMANTPFARLFTVLMKSGDESVTARLLSGKSGLTTGVWLLELAIVMLLLLPPLYRAWNRVAQRRRLLVFMGFLLLPMLLEFALLRGIGHAALQKGFYNQPGILGSPRLVNFWSALWTAFLLLFGYSCPRLLNPLPAAATPASFHQ